MLAREAVGVAKVIVGVAAETVAGWFGKRDGWGKVGGWESDYMKSLPPGVKLERSASSFKNRGW